MSAPAEPIAMHDDPTPLVLAIDDAPEVHRLLEVRLKGEAIELAHALDVSTGLTMARERPPDLILLDLALPGVDGFTIFQRLAEDATLSSVPVIFLTAEASTDIKV